MSQIRTAYLAFLLLCLSLRPSKLVCLRARRWALLGARVSVRMWVDAVFVWTLFCGRCLCGRGAGGRRKALCCVVWFSCCDTSIMEAYVRGGHVGDGQCVYWVSGGSWGCADPLELTTYRRIWFLKRCRFLMCSETFAEMLVYFGLFYKRRFAYTLYHETIFPYIFLYINYSLPCQQQIL